MIRPVSAAASAAGVVVVLVLQSCGGGGSAPAPELAWQGGPAVFRANCACCHGVSGGGGLSWIDPSFEAPAIAGYPAQYVKFVVREGRPHMMPAMPEQEIDSATLQEVAQYVQNLPQGPAPEPAFDVTVRVIDEDPWFDPPQINVSRGAVVRYVNAGATYHPLFELQSPAMGGEIVRLSGNLGPGGVWYHSFDPGIHTVLCGMHPYMQGEVHVTKTPFQPRSYSVDPPAPVPTVPGIGEVWVAAQFQDWPGRTTDGVIQVIDAATWAVTAQIPVGNNPHNVWFDNGSTTALVTSWFGTEVSTIDAVTKQVLANYPVGPSPAHVTSDYAGTMWYVSMEGTTYVQLFAQGMQPGSLGGWVPGYPRAWVTGYGPHGVWYTQGLLVTANSMDSTFSILDPSTLQELAMLPTGMLPLGVGADATGAFAATGNLMGMSVSLFDLPTRTHVRDIPVPGGAIQVPFTPDGTKIFAANGSFLTVIDVAKAANPLGFPDPASAIDASIWTGKGAHGVAFGLKAGGGLYAYVTHKFENYVSVIDVATLTKAGDIPLLLTTTGKISLAGSTDTGGNGVAVRPNPAPWQ